MVWEAIRQRMRWTRHKRPPLLTPEPCSAKPGTQVTRVEKTGGSDDTLCPPQTDNALLLHDEAEINAKKFELTELETKLTELRLELVTLQARCSIFERRFQAVVGALYLQLDQVRAEIKEVLA